MNSPMSKDDQIAALLTGRMYELISDRLGRSIVDVRPYVSVTRADIEAFLRLHRDAAEQYFDEKAREQPSHDADLIGLRDGKYVVAWRDHGRNRFERSFSTLAEAVADHVLVSQGMR